MKLHTGTVFGRLLILCACAWVSAPAMAQAAFGAPAPERRAAGTSLADGVSLLNSIKDVGSPAARAYLYSRLAAWLWREAGDDPSLREAAFDASVRGLSDIHAHQLEIPPAPAHMFYDEMLGIVRRHRPEEAERLERSYPL